jgi:hypothetical protein
MFRFLLEQTPRIAGCSGAIPPSPGCWAWSEGMMRLMFDTMNAYDRADFDRLAEIYAKDAVAERRP